MLKIYRYWLSLALLSMVLGNYGVSHAQLAAGTIVAENFNGLCLGVGGGSQEDNASLVTWDCVGIDDQNFIFEQVGINWQIKATHSGKCLGIRDASTAQGADVVQSVCDRRPSKLWIVTGAENNYSLQAAHTGLCLNVANANPNRGAILIQGPCENADQSQWRINADLTPGPDSGTNPQSKWNGPYAMPLVAGAAANLPDGRILTWAAWSKLNWEFGSGGQTATSIFNPANNQSTDTLVSNTEHDMFCPGTAQLPDGRVLVTGGNNAEASSIYSPQTNQWTKAADMIQPRGYHSMAPLSDGSVLALGGSWSGGIFGKSGEVWNPNTNVWTEKPGLNNNRLTTNDAQGMFRADNHYWIFTAPNDQVFHAGPSRAMNWLNTAGAGSLQAAAFRGDEDAMSGNAVMYDIGKILTLGGAANYDTGPATVIAHTIDINGGPGNVVVERSGNMNFPRVFHNSVVLPSGEVVVVGGQTQAAPFSDEGSVYIAEIWNPATGQFTNLSAAQVPRNYHSVALLMRDGRVFVAGGGMCNCSTDHPDAEILTPPYLLDTDGSAATRPFITNATNNASPGDNVTVTVNTNTDHSFALVRMSTVTHAVNNDERRIPLTATRTDNGQFSLAIPGNPAVVIPGNYFLFAMNAQGVPSIGHTINIQ